MTLADVVLELKEQLVTWQRVANVCNRKSGRRHSAGYYQLVASGKIHKPNAFTVAAIHAASAEMALKCPKEREQRYGLTVRYELGERLAAVKNARDLTWDELTEMVLDMLEEGEHK